MLQLAIEEEDDATSRLAVPRSPLPVQPSRLSHGLGQDDQNLNPELQVQGELSPGHGMLGDCGGEVADIDNALLSDQVSHSMSPCFKWFSGILSDCVINHVKEFVY